MNKKVLAGAVVFADILLKSISCICGMFHVL